MWRIFFSYLENFFLDSDGEERKEQTQIPVDPEFPDFPDSAKTIGTLFIKNIKRSFNKNSSLNKRDAN